MTLQKINIIRFLELSEVTPIADVRSPAEFNYGHIPGAVNIPLFDDKEREAIGIKFSNNGKLLVHCWRGGMRSEAMAWLFSLGDLEVYVLDGGYKSYRRYVLDSLSEKRKMIVLGGMTGSSKTHILRYLKSSGQQILDLEKLANHKGSAFGALGQLPQPTTEQFGNMLFSEWQRLNDSLPFWVEDESRNIGLVFMPDAFYFNMQETPTIVLVKDASCRLPRLIEEYSAYPPESLKASGMNYKNNCR